MHELSVAAMSLLMSFAREATVAHPPTAIEATRVAAPMRAILRIVGLDHTWVVHD